MRDIFDQDENSVVRGKKDRHGDELGQPEAQKVSLFQQREKTSALSG